MDEESLQTALQTYDAQLQQVELALDAGLDPSELADLRQLQGDLKELIELTEASLVSVRKSKLLATLDGQHPARDDSEYLAFQEAKAEGVEVPVVPREELETVPKREASPEPSKPGQEEEEEDGEEEEEEEWSGRKVNAPFYSSWGTLEYHNAMIVGTEAAEDGSAGVRVLYLYPTHKSLKPCPFFLEGKCRFKENCRLSLARSLSWHISPSCFVTCVEAQRRYRDVRKSETCLTCPRQTHRGTEEQAPSSFLCPCTMSHVLWIFHVHVPLLLGRHCSGVLQINSPVQHPWEVGP